MSRRGKKRVDYSQFGVLNEDDDDFAEFTPPVSKKMKTSSSRPEGKSKDKSSNKSEKDKDGRERKSINRPRPSDEAFESELQMALEISMSESQEVKEESPLVDIHSNKENKLQAEVDTVNQEEEKMVSSICNDSGANAKDIINLCKPVSRSDDEIEIIATDIPDNVKPRRTSVPHKAKIQEDSDFEGDLDDLSSEEEEEEEDDDDYNGEDSDFDDCKKKSKTKSKLKQATKTPAASKVKTAPAKATKATVPKPSASKSNVKPSVLKTPKASKPTVTRPCPVTRPPLTSPSPRWNPPGPAGNQKSDESSMRSPSSGLRIGLSRNMKLKPLHPNLKVPH